MIKEIDENDIWTPYQKSSDILSVPAYRWLPFPLRLGHTTLLNHIQHTRTHRITSGANMLSSPPEYKSCFISFPSCFIQCLCFDTLPYIWILIMGQGSEELHLTPPAPKKKKKKAHRDCSPSLKDSSLSSKIDTCATRDGAWRKYDEGKLWQTACCPGRDFFVIIIQ